MALQQMLARITKAPMIQGRSLRSCGVMRDVLRRESQFLKSALHGRETALQRAGNVPLARLLRLMSNSRRSSSSVHGLRSFRIAYRPNRRSTFFRLLPTSFSAFFTPARERLIFVASYLLRSSDHQLCARDPACGHGPIVSSSLPSSPPQVGLIK